jgi:mannosyl-3-phosphoglycerate phosphatase
MTHLAFFTDLDGTLLDAETYSFDPARGVIARLASGGHLLIPVTSKTADEVAPLLLALDIEGPAIIESGGGILRRAGQDPEIEQLGVDVERLRSAARVIQMETGAELRLFSEMNEEEASAASGLSGDSLDRARLRRFDEPFLLLSGSLDEIRCSAGLLGLAVRTGGRFHHLTGWAGKGTAVRRLIQELAASTAEPMFSVALGDSPMDAEFMSIADFAIIVPKPNGTPDEELVRGLPRARLAPTSGPAGWAKAVGELLDSTEATESARPREEPRRVL